MRIEMLVVLSFKSRRVQACYCVCCAIQYYWYFML